MVHGPLLTATLPEFVGSEQKREYEFFNQGKVLKLTGNLGNGIVDVLFVSLLSVGPGDYVCVC